MRVSVGNTTLDDSVLRQIWLQQFAIYVKSTLNVFVDSHSIDELAKAADQATERAPILQVHKGKRSKP
ncbi:unnamed protein product [Echinostoma caproni]|uniref:Plexin_cytopl domain-containing protein n=1 Tax=Echinostoma caproni TaxID=27848 RepID=A0A183BCQ2_9TREM|nr:unnamed protein product [Echinostoma caproni]